MYHVVSTGTAASVLYLISYTLYRTGFYNRNFHRKIWNILLAVTFLLAATAGLFLALQINYKWNIPFIKTILKWHVECGIGFAFTGIIHFIWHFRYFTRPETDRDQQEPQSGYSIRTAKQNALNLFLVGFVSSSVQLLMMREMMNIAGGYELITGTFLGSWLIGSAAGAAMAKRSLLGDIKKLNTVFALSPLLSVALLIILSRMMLGSGEAPTFLVSILLTLIVLLPFTFISGFVFIRILLMAGKSNHYTTGRLFSVETAGGVAAGLIVAVFGSGILNTYQILFLVLLIYIYYTTVSFFLVNQKAVIVSIPAFTAVCLLIILSDPDIFFRQQLLPAVRVTGTSDTPYGNITTGEYGGEISTYYNHHLLKWQNDEMEREENIHYAMIQRENAKNILIVSGDINSDLPELLKYPLEKIWVVERDPALLNISDANRKKGRNILQIRNEDAFRFIRQTTEMFDVILVILPPPSTLMLNRYYTTDFFSEAKKKLNNGGVFACSPGAGENYFNNESSILYSSVYNSLAAVFKNVVPIVGNKLYYLASDGELSTAIPSMIGLRKLTNSYVCSDFLADDLLKMKSDELLGTLDRNVRQNTLAVPVACFHFQSFSLSKSAGEKIPAYILMVLVFLTPLFMVRSGNMIMYSSAGALAGFEIILLLSLQSTAGNMYQLTGIILAGVMTGLAIGAGIDNPRLKALSVNISSFIALFFYLVIGVTINKLLTINSLAMVIFLLVLLSLIPSFLTGRLFRLLTENSYGGRSPSGVYSSDLAGSALGFIAFSSLAVPLLGMEITLFLLSGLIFAGFLLGTITNK